MVDQNVIYIEYELFDEKTNEIIGTYNTLKSALLHREIAIHEAKKAGEENPRYFVREKEI